MRHSKLRNHEKENYFHAAPVRSSRFGASRRPDRTRTIRHGRQPRTGRRPQGGDRRAGVRRPRPRQEPDGRKLRGQGPGGDAHLRQHSPRTGRKGDGRTLCRYRTEDGSRSECTARAAHRSRHGKEAGARPDAGRPRTAGRLEHGRRRRISGRRHGVSDCGHQDGEGQDLCGERRPHQDHRRDLPGGRRLPAGGVREPLYGSDAALQHLPARRLRPGGKISAGALHPRRRGGERPRHADALPGQRRDLVGRARGAGPT